MRDLSMHVLDIVQNSIKAGAKLIAVSFVRSPESLLTFTVKDDGCGMSPEFLARVTDPFTTTRTTRRVGLGIPMLKQSAEAAGGSFSLESEVGKGTVISASFDLRNIDCIPMGELCDSLYTLVLLNPDTPDFLFTAHAPDAEAEFDTRAVRQDKLCRGNDIAHFLFLDAFLQNLRIRRMNGGLPFFVYGALCRRYGIGKCDIIKKYAAYIRFFQNHHIQFLLSSISYHI